MLLCHCPVSSQILAALVEADVIKAVDEAHMRAGDYAAKTLDKFKRKPDPEEEAEAEDEEGEEAPPGSATTSPSFCWSRRGV